MGSARTPDLRHDASAEPSSVYLTVAAPARGQLREKMSRFISFIFPARTPEEARAAIAGVASEYHDARHVCWAYRLGADGGETMVNDNGEPSGTAGRPILGAIRSAGITNVAVAVVRYFGGIKLGTSGLIVAYKEATRLAIEAAEIVEGCETATVSITFPYQAVNGVMSIAKSPGLRIISQEFDNSCSMTIEVRADRRAELLRRLTGLDGVTEQ